MKIIMLIQLLMVSVSSYALEKSVRVSQVRGMNFDYIVSKQGEVTLDPLYCEQCAVVLVKGKPSTAYMIECELIDIFKGTSKIEVMECFLAHEQRHISREFSTDFKGEAYITIGTRLNVKQAISTGKHSGKIIINVNEKE